MVGLNEDYEAARGSILMMKLLPNIDQVYIMILQEAKKRSLNAMCQISNASAAFNTIYHKDTTLMPDHAVLVAQQQRFYNRGSNHSQRKPLGL